MPFLGLCDDDPLVEFLGPIFGANIIRVPEERIKPLCVLTNSNDRTVFRGKLLPLLTDKQNLDILIDSSKMIDISGHKSKSMDSDLGFSILGGFLGGFGIPSGNIKLKLHRVSKVSFSFQNIIRFYVDINMLGNILKGKIIDPKNPSAAIFFSDINSPFFVIDSVITSNDFSIHLEAADSQSFSAEISDIQNIVSDVKANIDVVSTTGYDITFRGYKQLAFAFSCIRFYLSSEGEIRVISSDDQANMLTNALTDLNNPYSYNYSPDRILLSKEPGMIDIEYD